MALDQTQYSVGMDQDENGYPIPKVKVSGLTSNSMQPVDIQSRYAQTVQVQNGVLVSPSGANVSANWIDTDGFSQIAATNRSSGVYNGRFQFLWSNDGVNTDSYELPAGTTATSQYRSACVDTKARYVKFEFDNLDATNAQTVTSYIYLKA